METKETKETIDTTLRWKYVERDVPEPRTGRQLCGRYQTGIYKVVGIGGLFLLVMSTLIAYHHTLWTGVVVLLYFINQCLGSFSNKSVYQKVANLVKTEESWDNFEKQKVGIVIVGYREKPEYFEKCMNSLRLYSSCFVNVIVLVVDGEEKEDEYMMEIAKKEWSQFSFHSVMTPITPLYPLTDSDMATIDLEEKQSTSQGRYTKPVLYTINRPHQGKRATMAYGIDFLKTNYPENREIIVMDSDTFLRKESIPNLVLGFREDKDEKNGCMTGSIEIFNKNYLLPRIVNARYGYAFSIERGAMSWYGCMNCCSGPFSIYRQDLMTDQLLSDFIGQKCCSEHVGPGDDRHLTNLVMMEGYKSRQNPFAIAWTETPKYLFRYLQQQTRWSRSYYREQIYQIFACTHQNLFLSCVTTWELFFPFFIMIGFFPYFNPSVVIYLHRILIAFFVAFLRTTVLITFYEGDFSYSHNIFIFLLYFLILLPIKLYALLTCCLQQWITSSRKNIVTTLFSPDTIGMCLSILLWYIVFVSSFYAQSTLYHQQWKELNWAKLYSLSF